MPLSPIRLSNLVYLFLFACSSSSEVPTQADVCGDYAAAACDLAIRCDLYDPEEEAVCLERQFEQCCETEGCEGEYRGDIEDMERCIEAIEELECSEDTSACDGLIAS
jgi:hypothetical protein